MAAMSGVEIQQNCVDAYNKVKAGKAKFAIMKISANEKQIELVEEAQAPYKQKADPADFEKFISYFQPNVCRYGVYITQIACQGGDGLKGYRDKVIFITWAPDTASIKQRMMISSSKEGLKKACLGHHYAFQFNDEGDCEASQWIDKLNDQANMKIVGDIVEFEGRVVADW